MTGLGKPRIDEVQTAVAEIHGVTKADLKCESRKHAFAHARQEAMYLARELTGSSYPLLGKHFGDRDHTTALFAYRKIQANALTDPKLEARLQACRARIVDLVEKRIGKKLASQGSSSDWSPPPPLQISKPTTIVMSMDLVGWRALGGKLECAA